MKNTIKSKLGREVHITSDQLNELRKSELGVTQFLSKKAEKKEVFKITFDDGHELKYSDLKTYTEFEGSIDDGDIIKYHDENENKPKRERKERFIFHRHLFESDGTERTDGTAKILAELKLRGLPDDLTIQNIRKLVPTTPMIKVTKSTTIEDLDMKIIREIPKLSTVQVVNCGKEESADANVTHPFALLKIFSLEKLISPNEENVEIPGVFIPYYYYSFRWFHTVFHVEDLCYVSINIHAGGADKVWTAIPASEEKKFWEHVKKMKNKKRKFRDTCTAFMRTKSVLITHKQLDKWKIKYNIFIQKKGEIIVTPVQCPHQVISLGDCVNHTVNLIDPAWCMLSKNGRYICDDEERHGGAHGGGPLNVNSMGLLQKCLRKLENEKIKLDTSAPKQVPLSSSSPSLTISSQVNLIPAPRSHKRGRSPEFDSTTGNVDTLIAPTSTNNAELCIACKTDHPSGICVALGCIPCGKSYSTFYKTRNHILKFHNGHKKAKLEFECDVCSKSYSRKDNLQRHINNTHESHN